jgi:hypothetical protein
MVPETEATTRFHLFIFVSVAAGSFLRAFLPIVRWAALFIGRPGSRRRRPSSAMCGRSTRWKACA